MRSARPLAPTALPYLPRRGFLKTSLGLVAAGFLPSLGCGQEADPGAQFLALCAVLTGYESASLDPALADTYRAALEKTRPQGLAELLTLNPSLLIIVEGLNYATDFSGVYASPLSLSVAGRLVYSAHDYAWFHPTAKTYAELKTAQGNSWGFLLVQGKPYTAPVWVGEFGTCHTGADCLDGPEGQSSQGLWFAGIRRYLDEADIDWAYWALNGTQARGTSRTYGAEETYGILDTSWGRPALDGLQTALAALQPVRQRP